MSCDKHEPTGRDTSEPAWSTHANLLGAKHRIKDLERQLAESNAARDLHLTERAKLRAALDSALRDRAGLIRAKKDAQISHEFDEFCWEKTFRNQWHNLQNWGRKWDRIYRALAQIVRPKFDESICQMAERAAAEYERLSLAYDTLERQRSEFQQSKKQP